MAEPAPRQVDLMIDLRERMVRIETKLDLRAAKDLEVDESLASLASRTTALETEGVVLRAKITTLKWVGAAAITVVTVMRDTLLALVV